jgi:two-component system, NarL family, sensor kinase
MTANEPTISRRQHELTVLTEVAASLNERADLQGVLDGALRSAAELLDLETGWIWLLDEGEGGSSYLAAQRNLPPALGDHPERMETQGCWCLDAYRKGTMQEVVRTGVVECSRLAQADAIGTGGLRFHTSVPLIASGQRLGLLNVASRHRSQLSTADDRLLRAIGDLLSVAVERSRLFEASTRAGAAEERLRLSREIHDSLGQGMTAVLLRLESLEAGLDDNAPPATRQLLCDTIDLARQNLDEARRAVLDLRALSVESEGLAGALASLAAAEGADGVPVRWRHRGGLRPLPTHVEAGLYRIAQEALNNARRHAQASAIELALTMTPGKVSLVISDDGCGFDPLDVGEGHHGLMGLTERARLLGAVLQLESSPGEGTRIGVELAVEMPVIS